MKERLFTEDGLGCANEHCNQIEYLINTQGLNATVKYCLENNICLRDAQAYAAQDVSIAFSAAILKAAQAKRLKDKNK